MKYFDKRIDLLKKAAKDGHSIIHFSDLENKLGINPKTKYNTPAGVYGYILSEKSLPCVIDKNSRRKIDSIKECGLSNFAVDRAFVHVAEFNPSSKKIVINIDAQGYCDLEDEDFLVIIKKLENMIENDHPSITFGQTRTLLDEIDYYRFRWFWGNRSNVDKLWQITRVLSRNPIAWGRLFYDLGVGAIFDHGWGMIHQAEPAQAVVFETNRLNVIYSGKNIFFEIEGYEKRACETVKSLIKLFKSNRFIKSSSVKRGNSRIETEFFLDIIDPRIYYWKISAYGPDTPLSKIGSVLVEVNSIKEETYISAFYNDVNLNVGSKYLKLNKYKKELIGTLDVSSVPFSIVGYTDYIINNSYELYSVVKDFSEEIDPYIIDIEELFNKNMRLISDFKSRQYDNVVTKIHFSCNKKSIRSMVTFYSKNAENPTVTIGASMNHLGQIRLYFNFVSARKSEHKVYISYTNKKSLDPIFSLLEEIIISFEDIVEKNIELGEIDYRTEARICNEIMSAIGDIIDRDRSEPTVIDLRDEAGYDDIS